MSLKNQNLEAKVLSKYLMKKTQKTKKDIFGKTSNDSKTDEENTDEKGLELA